MVWDSAWSIWKITINMPDKHCGNVTKKFDDEIAAMNDKSQKINALPKLNTKKNQPNIN